MKANFAFDKEKCNNFKCSLNLPDLGSQLVKEISNFEAQTLAEEIIWENLSADVEAEMSNMACNLIEDSKRHYQQTIK
jgi:hypothetical protein